MPRGLLVLALVTVTPLLGCFVSTHRLYEGQPKPQAEIALLENKHGPLFSQVTIHSIDGRLLRGASNIVAELLPGPHAVLVSYQGVYHESAGPLTLQFSAVAGHRYRVSVRLNTHARTWTPVLTDLTTGDELVP